MITAEEFVLELSNDEEQKNLKLATVVDLFENQTAKIEFDGEDIPSEKQYAYLKSYIPTIGDRILLAAIGGTYIILGKVNYNVSPESDEPEIDRYIFDEKQVLIKKGLDVIGGANVDNLTADDIAVDGDIGASGTVRVTGVSATGVVSAGSLSTSGNLNAGSSNLGSTKVNGTLRSTGTMTSEGQFAHQGGAIGFFNKSPATKRSVGYASTESETQSRLNDLLGALKAYGLIG